MATILALALALFAPPDDASLDVTVTDEKGAPIAGAAVLVWGEEYDETGTADAGGRARFTAVPPGAYNVQVSARGFVGDERNGVAVAEGAAVALTFALPAGVPFSGRVVDEQGAPVAGAYVVAVAGGTFEGYVEAKMRPPYARTWTDGDGAFAVGGIPEGAVATLVVRAEDCEEARVAVRAQGGAVRPSPLAIVLRSGGRLTGRVVGPDGRPVPGAAVLVVPADHADLRRNPHLSFWSSDGGSARAIVATAGEDGRFALGNLAFGKPFVAMAEAPGFARSAESAVFTIDEGHRVVEVALALRKSGAIVVRLADPAGAAVSAARVRIGDPMSGLDREEADAPGVFRFADLIPGTHEVHVSAPGFVPRDETVVLAEGETRDLPLALSEGVAIEGVVVDDEGKPVPGVIVRAERTVTTPDGWTSTSEAGRTESGMDGRFVLRGLLPGPHVLDIFGDGLILPAGELKVEAPARDLRLAGAWLGTVTIRLRAPEGAALPEEVYFWDHTPDGSGSGSGHALSGGRLTARLHPGRHHLLVAAEGYLPVERDVEIALGQDLDLGEAVLDPGVTLAGRVVDLAGKPVAGALVEHGGYSEAVTDAEGRFVLPHVPAGTVEIGVAAEGYLPLRASVAAGKDAVPAALTLRRGGLLTGTLRDGEGRPLPDHWLQVRPAVERPEGERKSIDECGTDEDGRFTVRVPPGSYRLVFVAEEGGAVTVLAEFTLAEGEAKDVAAVLRGR